MRTLVTNFVTIMCFFHADYAMSAATSAWSPTYACTATETLPPPNKYPVKLSFRKIGQDVSVLAKSSHKDLNFQFGNGKLISENTSDKSSYNCTNNISQTDSFYSFEYNCERIITDIDSSKKVTSRIAARVSLNNGNAIGGELCSRVSSVGSICWELSECK